MRNMSLIFAIIALLAFTGCEKWQKIDKEFYVQPITFKIKGQTQSYNKIMVRNEDGGSSAGYIMCTDGNNNSVCEKENIDDFTFIDGYLGPHEHDDYESVKIKKGTRVLIMVWKDGDDYANILENFGAMQDGEDVSSDQVNVWTGVLKRVKFDYCDAEGCYGQGVVEEGSEQEIVVELQYPESVSFPTAVTENN